MRGTDFFPREDEREWARQYDRAVQHYMVLRANAGRDFTQLPMNTDDWEVVCFNLKRDQGYDEWRVRTDRENEGQRIFWKGVDELNLQELQEVTFDRPKLQAFRIKYDTLDEVRMRFNKTIIMVKGNPFYVSDQRHIGNDFYLLLENGGKKKAYVDIQAIPDLRPPPAGYIQVDGINGFFMRLPARINQQGLTSQSVVIIKVGSVDKVGFGQMDLVDALAGRSKTLKWDKAYHRLLDDRIVSSLRLSDKLALYKKANSENIVTEYKGRKLGVLRDHTIHLADEDDGIQPWLKRDANNVDLEIAT